MVLWLLWSLIGKKNHLSKRWGMASFTFQQLEFFCIRTWQWVMFILQTAVIARMSPAPTFGQVASRLRPADSQLCYQRQAKAQHCCKTPCHQKLIQQSSLTVVKNIPSQSAGKATKECTADNLPGSAGSLALKAGRGMASQAHWLLFPVLPPQQLYFAHLHQFFTVLTVLCYIIFYVFCHWYTRRIISIKRKARPQPSSGFFLSIYSSDQSTHFYNCSVTAISLLCHLPLCKFYTVAQHLWSWHLTVHRKKKEEKSENFVTCELTLKKMCYCLNLL